MTSDEYEKRARRLIGNTIAKVVYHEIDYGDGEFHFFDDPRFDSLDHGLEFQLGTGELLSCTWGSEFKQYGISLIDDEMSTVVSQSRFLDVSETRRWEAVLGRTVESVDVFWSWCQEFGKPETRVHYPQDLLLRFEGKLQIVISALEIRDGDRSMPMMDNITIFDDIQVAKSFGCLYQDNKC